MLPAGQALIYPFADADAFCFKTEVALARSPLFRGAAPRMGWSRPASVRHPGQEGLGTSSTLQSGARPDGKKHFFGYEYTNWRKICSWNIRPCGRVGNRLSNSRQQSRRQIMEQTNY